MGIVSKEKKQGEVLLVAAQARIKKAYKKRQKSVQV